MRGLYAVLLTAAMAQAQEADVSDVEKLLDEPVVVGASRAKEQASDAPGTITTVTQEQLRQYGLRTVADAMNFLSVGLLALDPLHAVEVGARGVLLHGDYGNHLVVLVDGHLLNEPWDGTAYVEQGLGIPIELIDHLELMPGPGSVNYGSYAMLGVVNIVTRRAKDLPLQVHLEGSLSPGQDVAAAPVFAGFGGGGRLSVLGGYERALLGVPFEVVLGLEYQASRGQVLTFAPQTGLLDTDGTRTWPMNWGPQTPLGTWGGTTSNWGGGAPSGVLKVRWGEWELWAKGNVYQRGSPAMGSLAVVEGDFGADNWERDRFLSLELKWTHALNARVTVSARGYFDLYDYFENQVVSSWTTFGSGAPLQVDPRNFTFLSQQTGSSQWGGVELQAAVDWLGDGRFPLLAGVDGRGRAYQSSEPFRGVDGVLLDTLARYAVTEWQVAPWVQQRVRLWSWLTLNLGLRLDAQSTFAPTFSPRVALVWVTPWEGHLKLMYSSAFRSPVGFERFQQFANYQVQDPFLAPEKVRTGELSYEQRFGRQRVLVVGFVSSYTELIRLELAPVYLAANGEYWYVNQGALLNVGASALFEGSVGRLGYGVSVTGAVNRSDDPLVASPTWFGNARVSWSFGERRPRVSLAAAFTGPSLTDVALNTAEGVGYSLAKQWAAPQVNVRVALELPTLPVKGLSARVVVGSSLTAFSPFVAGPQQSPDPANPGAGPNLSPNTRLFGMASVSWALDAPR
jgi:outer membrane receptor protein involved in Fe transport